MSEPRPDLSPPSSSLPASFALALLLVLVVASPWAFGSVDPAPRFVLVSLALGASALALSLAAARNRLELPEDRKSVV